MTRKDYELIARAIRARHDAYREATGETEPAAVIYLRGLVSDFARQFGYDNPRFDPDKFTRACGF